MKWKMTFRYTSGVEEHSLGTDKLTIFRLTVHNGIVTAMPGRPPYIMDWGWLSSITGKELSQAKAIINKEFGLECKGCN